MRCALDYPASHALYDVQESGTAPLVVIGCEALCSEWLDMRWPDSITTIVYKTAD